ncbi:MAG: hypothetical protein J3R72DRAFT_454209 [Linnemannia gamsii]|nr:MAG: hypothetical protein J3R72DRAFT_454209 [Linnemannia gamsii]
MPKNPKVLIVGAGLGGLTLAILLERMGDVDYEIFERSTSLKPYGAGMIIGPNILPVFEQLGLLDEITKVSFPRKSMDIYQEDLTLISSMLQGELKENIGYDSLLFSRPHLHKLMLSKVPPEKIRYGKKVLSVGQSEYGVLLRCSDKSVHEGDILVGADGAYSAVRQSMYERLVKEKKLPKIDTLSLNVGYTCMVGTTLPQDPEVYNVLKDDFSHFAVVIADGKPHSWTIITVPGNRIAWGVVIQLSPEEKDSAFRNSEWGPESLGATISQVEHHKVPYGGTLGDLINATPRELVSKVYLEEKLFETWNHNRICLIGDACHKMLPSAGQGAINAMQDAVVLANCIYEMRSNSHDDIKTALKDYKRQRYTHAKQQVENSNTAGKLLYGQNWFEKFMRKAVLAWLPKSFEKNNLTKAGSYRPQASFLPQAPVRGTVPVLPQKPSKRYQEELRRHQQESMNASASAAVAPKAQESKKEEQVEGVKAI